jgi:hypothetical protein
MEVSGEDRAKHFSSISLDLYHLAWGFVRKSNKIANLLKFNKKLSLYKIILNTANMCSVQIIFKTASFNDPS